MKVVAKVVFTVVQGNRGHFTNSTRLKRILNEVKVSSERTIGTIEGLTVEDVNHKIRSLSKILGRDVTLLTLQYSHY